MNHCKRPFEPFVKDGKLFGNSGCSDVLYDGSYVPVHDPMAEADDVTDLNGVSGDQSVQALEQYFSGDAFVP